MGCTHKLVSVIIPDTNSVMIGAIVKRLKGQTAVESICEVLIAGSDEPGLVVQDGLVRFVETAQGTFAAAKRNIGMRLAQGDIFAFLDDDCLPAPDWLERLLYWHGQGELIVGGSVTFGCEHYLQLGDNVSAFHDLLPSTRAGARPYLVTANLSVRREVVEAAGAMQVEYKRADDLEWTARFRQHGYRLYFAPDAVVWHDPPRRSLASVWRHWVDDAPDTLHVRLRYRKMLNTPRAAQWRWMYLWGAAFVAAWATGRTFAHPRALARYWQTLPLVYLTKLVWCWSAYRSFNERR